METMIPQEKLRSRIEVLLSERYFMGLNYVKDFLHRSSADEEALYEQLKEQIQDTFFPRRVLQYKEDMASDEVKLQIEEALFSNLKERALEKFEMELKERIVINGRLTELIEEIKVVEHFADPNVFESHMAELVSLKASEHKFCEKWIHFQSSVEDSTRFSHFLEAKNYIRSALDSGNNPGGLEELKNMCKNGSVFVQEDDFNTVTQYGKVAVKDGRFRVYDFQSEKPQGELFNFKELCSRKGKSTQFPTTVFMQFSPKSGVGEDFEVVIETDGISQRSRNLVLLCSGLYGCSYKGLYLRGMESHLDLAGPPTVVPGGLNDYDSEFTAKEGGVYGMEEDESWLWFVLNDRLSYPPMVGVVVSGLQNLRDLEGEWSVSNCGLVI